MTINLPENLERSILGEVRSGHFASVDDAIAEAVRLLLRQGAQKEEGPTKEGPGELTASAHKPIWEVFEEITASIPEEEWAKLAADGAEQHDHYIYGTPKRPTS
jgi:Arc/MetJ-type ribon-helix-helix transcriptional regulator